MAHPSSLSCRGVISRSPVNHFNHPEYVLSLPPPPLWSSNGYCLLHRASSLSTVMSLVTCRYTWYIFVVRAEKTEDLSCALFTLLVGSVEHVGLAALPPRKVNLAHGFKHQASCDEKLKKKKKKKLYTAYWSFKTCRYSIHMHFQA